MQLINKPIPACDQVSAPFPAHARGGRIGYVLIRYPRLSETFVLNEILGLEEAGLEVSIFSLGFSDDPRVNPGVPKVRAATNYLAQAGTLHSIWVSLKAMRKLGASEPEAVDKALDFAERLPLGIGPIRMVQALDLAESVVNEKISHLHAHFMTGTAEATYLAHLITGVPFTVTAHAVDVYSETVDPAVFSEIAKSARALVTVCEANREYIQAHLMEGQAGRIVRVYNGLPLDAIHPPRNQIPPSRLILGVGRLVEKKGWPVLLDACRILKAKGLDFTCLIAGGGEDHEGLLEKREEAGVEDRVTMLGATGHDQVLDLMADARVLAAPCIRAAGGDQDALPTVILEALASGLPVVSTEVGGIREIIDDGVEGLLVPESDPESLADALEKLLADDVLWKSQSAAGPLKVAAQFDLAKTLPQLIELFKHSEVTAHAEVSKQSPLGGHREVVQ